MAKTKIPGGYIADNAITGDHIADNVITSAMLHTSFTVSSSNLSSIDTDNVSEGASNLYYTDARVGSYLSTNGYATQSTIVAAITDSAPATLDTLNELAAALGDDANFSTTVTNSIALKAPIASPDFTGDATFDTSTLVVDSTNNRVGIGTSSPNEILELSQDQNPHLRFNNADTSVLANDIFGTLEWYTNDGSSSATGIAAEIRAYADVDFTGSTRSTNIDFLTASGTTSPTTRMTIHHDGNVGIGTASPSNFLTIDAGSTVLGGITISGSAAPSMRLTDTTNNHIFYHIVSDNLVKSGSSTNCDYQFMTNDVVRMTLDTSGNLAIDGTVDGRDIAADGTKLDGIESGATADQTQSDINALAITQVGTISSGTWQGTAIASAYLDSDTAHLSGTQTFSGAKTFTQDIDVGSQTGTWITSDVMSDAIGWNNSYGVYIGSDIGGTHYLRGNGTFTTGGSTYNLWHQGNDGPGSGLDADTLDGVQGSSYLRSDATDTFTTLSGTQLNLGSEVQLRESTDRADLLQITSVSSTWAGLQVRNSNNEGRWSFMTDGSVAGIYDDENGKWHIQMDELGETRLYHNATERITATSVGADVLGQLYVDSSTNAKFILQGSNDPYMVFKEGTTDRVHIGWDSTNDALFFTNVMDNSVGVGNFFFKSGDLDDAVKIGLTASDGDVYGYLYGNHSNEIGLLDQDGSWAIRHVRDQYTQFRDNDNITFEIGDGATNLGDYGTAVTCNTGKGGWAGYSIEGRVVFMHDIDGNSWGIFNDVNNEWMILGDLNGTVGLRYNNSSKFETTSGGAKVIGSLDISGDLNNVTDIYVDDQIIHTGDTDTYIQFNAANSWRVVAGGSAQLTVTTSGLSTGNISAGTISGTNLDGTFKALGTGISYDTGSRSTKISNGIAVYGAYSGGSNSPTTYDFSAQFIDDGRGFELTAAWHPSSNLFFRTLRDCCSNWTGWYTVWNSNNDGAGTGLDADLLDGAHGSSYVRSDQADVISVSTGNSSNTFEVNNQNTSHAANVLMSNSARSASGSYDFFESFSGFSDAEFRLRGDGQAYADGSWNGGGADYAEYFESTDGSAIPVGTTVVLDSGKVRAATADDSVSDIIGVVRPFGTSATIGNDKWNYWQGKYETDDYGGYIWEDHSVISWTDEYGEKFSYESHRIPEGVTIPDNATTETHEENGKKYQHKKLNSSYDESLEYVPREERDEWNIIGLLGQIPITVGQPKPTNWIKLKDVSDTVELYFVK